MFEAIFHQSTLPQVVIEPDLTYRAVNDAFYEFLGYTKDEFDSLTIEGISHPDDFLLDFRQFQKLKAGHLPEYEMIKRYIHKDGGVKTGRLKVSKISDRATGRILYLGQVFDLTEKMKMYEGIRISEQKYRLLAEHCSDVICLHDPNGLYLYLSPSVKGILGYEPHELIGCYPLQHIHPDDQDSINFDKNTITFRGRKKDGTYIWIESTIKKVIDSETRQVEQYITVSRNIQQRIETDELLRKSEKLAVVGRMAAAVAHEIRNPLTPIKGFMQLVTLGEEISPSFATIILNEINRIEMIISEFLSLAKPHSEKKEAICVMELLDQVVQIFVPQAMLNNKEIVFHKNSKYNKRIEGDCNSLKQVFINILQNALDAIEEKGKVVVSLNDSGENLCVKIIDNGCGMPEERMKLIGEPFYSTKEKGTGLGLTTSYSIIKNHDGSITFESKEGEGTKVIVSLPYIEKEA